MTNALIQFMHTTAAYQGAVAQLLIGEANFVARELELDNWRPIATTNDARVYVGSPPQGVEGTLVNGEWRLVFRQGHLSSVMRKMVYEGEGKNWPTLQEMAGQVSLVGTNEVGKLLLEKLGKLGIRTNLMMQSGAMEVQQRRNDETGGEMLLPLFVMSWKETNTPGAQRGILSAMLRGDTLQWALVGMPPARYQTRTPLSVTNAAELLGEFPQPRQFLERLYGGAEKFAALTEPERVEIELLEVSDAGPPNSEDVRVGPIIVSAGRARMLSAILADFDSYFWGARKLCSPRYGVRLRFTRGRTSVVVLLCFECDELLVDGKHPENFDFAHNRLLGVVRSIFPADAALKGIEPQTRSLEQHVRSLTEIQKRKEADQ